VDLMVTDEAAKEAAIAAATMELQATSRQLCDVELIMNGGFSPIIGFMDETTYKHVVENMALPDGTIFGLPVVFDTDSEDLQPGMTVLLKQGDLPIATVTFTDKFVPNKAVECKKCYGTSEIEHPGALMVATERGKYYMGGTVVGVNSPAKHPRKYVLHYHPIPMSLPSNVVILSTEHIMNYSPEPWMIHWWEKMVSFSYIPLVVQHRPMISVVKFGTRLTRF
jgi:ATP sulfurylase